MKGIERMKGKERKKETTTDFTDPYSSEEN